MRTLLFILVLSFLSCKKDNLKSKQYLFLGHIYQWAVPDNNRIDYRFKDFDFNAWDQVWLGGDLCARTNESNKTLNYLDSIFNLSAPRTHWAIGNHDIKHGELKNIENKTKRNSFYTTNFDGLCLIVLNTTEFFHPNYAPTTTECKLLDDQLLMLQNIADTIQNASHCIVLHHHALLNNTMIKDSIDIGNIFNVYHPELKTSCKNADTFEKTFYSIFKRIQAKGVRVVLIGGDLGQRAKEFEYQTSDGIWFLGSGINNSGLAPNMPAYVTDTSPDKVLVFTRQVGSMSLSWEFVYLDSLIKKTN